MVFFCLNIRETFFHSSPGLQSWFLNEELYSFFPEKHLSLFDIFKNNSFLSSDKNFSRKFFLKDDFRPPNHLIYMCRLTMLTKKFKDSNLFSKNNQRAIITVSKPKKKERRKRMDIGFPDLKFRASRKIRLNEKDCHYEDPLFFVQFRSFYQLKSKIVNFSKDISYTFFHVINNNNQGWFGSFLRELERKEKGINIARNTTETKDGLNFKKGGNLKIKDCNFSEIFKNINHLFSGTKEKRILILEKIKKKLSFLGKSNESKINSNFPFLLFLQSQNTGLKLIKKKVNKDGKETSRIQAKNILFENFLIAEFGNYCLMS